MKKILLGITFSVGFYSLCYAGNAHFVSCVPVVSGDEVCVTGKEAGLGNLDQVHIVLSVVAHCQNRGGNNPKAANKETFGAEFDEPVQNGKALYEVCVTTEFTPDCAPPMSVVVDSISLVDTTQDPDVSCAQVSQ